MSQVNYDHVCVDDKWTRVCSIGELEPTAVSKDYAEPTTLVLVIPGNPGVCDMYEEFCCQVYDTLKQFGKENLSVWCVSHAGHTVLPSELPVVKDAILLREQIDLKLNFIRQFIPTSVQLCLVGHSIGSQMILEMLDVLKQEGYQVGHSSLLFPTIERMLESPAGSRVGFVRRWHLLRPLMLLAFVLCQTFFALDCLKHACLSLCYGNQLEKCVRQGTVTHLFNYRVLRQIALMGMDEMEKVREANLPAVKRHLANLHLYYGADDHWVPLNYYERLRVELGDRPNLILCEDGVEHAFVLTSTLVMAKKVAGWIQEATQLG